MNPKARIELTCIVVTIAAIAVACSSDKDGVETWEGTIDTLESGVVHVKNPSVGLGDSGIAWRLQPSLRIGSLEGDGPEIFTQIAALQVDDAGRVYVIDRYTQEVRVFHHDGRHVRTLGRDGEGPGEFRGANGLGWGPDRNLWVVDQGLNRFTVFDTSGALVATIRAPMAAYGWVWEGGFTDAGDLFDLGAVYVGDQWQRVLMKFDMVSQYSDTFPLPDYEEPTFVFESPGRQSFTSVPFAPQLAWTIGPDASVWIGIGDRYLIYRTTLDGDTTHIVEREYEPIPVSPEERAAAIERVERSASGYSYDAGRIPKLKPAFEQIEIDSEGFLWVRLPYSVDQKGTRFDVFDQEGRFVGHVDAPERVLGYVRFVVRGDMLYYVATDAMDAHYVVAATLLGR